MVLPYLLLQFNRLTRPRKRLARALTTAYISIEVVIYKHVLQLHELNLALSMRVLHREVYTYIQQLQWNVDGL